MQSLFRKIESSLCLFIIYDAKSSNTSKNNLKWISESLEMVNFEISQMVYFFTSY